MNDISKNVPDAEVKADDKVESGFNRTVVVASHGSGSAANRTMALNHSGIFDHKSKKAVEDIVGGVDINPYFDWFDSFKLTLTTTDGKPSSIVIDNGSIPHNNYGFTLPTSATDCYYDATKKMICRTSDMTELISYDNGKISIPFSLDGKGVSYKYVLTTK